MRTFFCALVLTLFGLANLRAKEAAVISPATRDDRGFLIHEVESPFQSGSTQIRVLTPDEPEAGTAETKKQYRVVYVLPVEAGVEKRYGDGLLEIQKLDLHNKFQAIFVTPTFSHLPWYADHPTDTGIRQESHFVKVVTPFVDGNYPVLAKTEGRLLLGFSKSGWGAWSLMLRHPRMFHKAAAWDAPMTMDQPGPFGSGPIFGTPANFADYRISQLLSVRAADLQQQKRLFLHGYGNFRQAHEQTHALLDSLRIAHAYQQGPARKHDWHSGWVPEAVEWLLSREESE